MNKFSSPEEFEDQWKLLDTDESGHLDRSEFDAEENVEAWNNYSSNGVTLQKEYNIDFAFLEFFSEKTPK